MSNGTKSVMDQYVSGGGENAAPPAAALGRNLVYGQKLSNWNLLREESLLEKETRIIMEFDKCDFDLLEVDLDWVLVDPLRKAGLFSGYTLSQAEKGLIE
jgi:hypothetical protein